MFLPPPVLPLSLQPNAAGRSAAARAQGDADHDAQRPPPALPLTKRASTALSIDGGTVSTLASTASAASASPDVLNRVFKVYNKKFMTVDELLSNNKKWAAAMVKVKPDYFLGLAAQQSPHLLWIGWCVLRSLFLLSRRC
jgi:hypothetical protein